MIESVGEHASEYFLSEWVVEWVNESEWWSEW